MTIALPVSDATPKTLAERVVLYLDYLYAPETFAAFGLLLCALSGRTARPVSARTVGNGQFHTHLALTIAELLTKESAVYFTSATEAGILSLREKNQPRSLLYEGRYVEPATMFIFARLIAGKPLRHLSASTNGTKVLTELNEPVAVLLFGCDEDTAGLPLSKMLTVRLQDTRLTRRQHGARRLEYFTTNRKDGEISVKETADALIKELGAVAWEHRQHDPELRPAGHDGQHGRAVAGDDGGAADERQSERARGLEGLDRSSSDSDDQDAYLVEGWPRTLDDLAQLIDLAILGYQMKDPASLDTGFSSQRAKGLEPSTFTLAT